MSQAIVPLSASQLPAHLQRSQEQARAAASELSTGVTASFPIISYRGKVWRIRKGGEEIDFKDANGDPVPSIELVFVKSNKLPSKTYYAKKYEEGDTESPICWSSDGIRPDSSVPAKQNPVCATCKHNQWGSRMTESGKKGRACSDVRRMAVVFADELARKGTDSHLFLMRVPPASLNPLKDYAEKVLGPAGIEYFALATRVGFDSTAAHPKLTFRAATVNNQPRFLTVAEYAAVCALRDSDDAARMLSEEPDFAGAGTTGAEDAAPGQNEAPAPAPASNGAAKPARARPVDEEDVPVATSGYLAVAAPVAVVAPAGPDEVEDAEYEDEEPTPAPAPVAAPPPPAPRKRKPRPPAPASTPVVEVAAPVAAQVAAPAAGTTIGGFDALLDSLLGK